MNGSAAPTTNVDAIGVNVSSVIREVTGTNTSGSIFAIDVNCASGCSGGLADTDDGTIAGAQVTGLQLGLQYVWDGSNWKRQTIGTAGSGSAQITTIQGNASGTPVPVSGTVTVSGVAGTEYVQNTSLTIASTQGGMAMGRASAAAPTDVIADGYATLPWYLRSGAQAVQLTNSGVLTVSGSGNASGAMRMEIANNGTGRMATVDTVTAVGSITNALPAGTNAIGKLTSNSGVTIGDVNVISIITGTGATSLGKAVDGAAGATDTGVMALAVRDDALTTLTPVDGDYTQLRTNSTGALWVQSSTVDVAENVAVGTNPVPVGGVYRSSPVTLDSGDVGYPLLDVNGRLIVNCNTGCSGGTQYTQDAALTVGTSIVTLAGGRASAAVPSDVSADNDAVMAWYLKSGAQATQPTYGGALAVAGNGASGTGVQRVTIANDSTGVIALAAGSALAGEVVPVTTASTTDTALRCTIVTTASPNSANCKGSSGNVYGFRFVNTTATLYYLRMYNLATAPTCSSGTGFVESIPIPASATGAGIVAMEPFGEGYSAGIGFCVSPSAASNDGANGAVGVYGTVLYK